MSQATIRETGSVPRLEVQVRKSVSAPLRSVWFRQVLRACSGEREVAARLPAEAELTLLIASDRTLRRLNREFLSEDHATDVLSFPSGDGAEPGYIGDVAVSWPAVRRQAQQFGHPIECEAGLLAVHGLLHLLGFDHTGRAEEWEMTAVTRRCLARAGVPVNAGRLAPP